MAVYGREFGISFPRIRPKLESWDLRKSHDNKLGQPKALLAFQYLALYNALPETWRQPREHVIFDPSTPMFHGRDIESVTTKYAREKFLEYESSTPCCVNFWARKFDGFEITKDVFSLPFQVTKERYDSEY